MNATQSFPATARNREPILAVLARVLPSEGTLLEIASGTGEHAVWMAPRLPSIRWQTSDVDPAMRASIAAWIAETGVANVAAPLGLDVCATPWPIESADAIYCANMIHIAPWSVCEALVRGATTVLAAGAPMVLYGPFKVGGVHTAESNATFDASLRRRDPQWGVRDLERVIDVARGAQLRHVESVSLPANNQAIVFRRQ